MDSRPALPAHSVEDVLDILSRPDDRELTEIVDLVAELCGAEAAGITILKDDEYHVLITHGILPLVCGADDTFCQHTMTVDGVYQIEDARTDARFADIGWVNGDVARVRFYASAPIYGPLGTMVGRLCVVDSEPKRLSALQLKALDTMGASVTQLIELRLLQASRTPAEHQEVQQSALTLMSQLAAELSHDLRVPLASITASVEMLEEALADHPDPAVRGLLGRTLRNARRMDRMLDSHMEAVRPETGATQVDVDLEKVVQQVMLDFAALLEPAAVRVHIGELPVVRAHPDEMYSVLQNLLTNAVKFARPGVVPEVWFAARRAGRGWRISVSDNGIGIPAERRHDVFSLFSRAHSGVEGHGIGLATVARIVTSHGGRVGAAESAAGGAEVWFELPEV